MRNPDISLVELNEDFITVKTNIYINNCLSILATEAATEKRMNFFLDKVPYITLRCFSEIEGSEKQELVNKS